MNLTLQDRLVKALRLAGVSSMHDGNAFAPKFMEDFNRRFARVPRNCHDAHRLSVVTRTSTRSSPGTKSAPCRATW